MAGGEDAGWIYDDTAADNNGSPVGGKRQLIRGGGGLTSRVRDPGWGAVSTVSPQRMEIDDVFQTIKQSKKEPQLHPPEISTK